MGPLSHSVVNAENEKPSGNYLIWAWNSQKLAPKNVPKKAKIDKTMLVSFPSKKKKFIFPQPQCIGMECIVLKLLLEWKCQEMT